MAAELRPLLAAKDVLQSVLSPIRADVPLDLV